MAEMQEKMMMKLICVSEGFEDAGKADLTILPFADGRRLIWHPCLKGRVSASGNLKGEKKCLAPVTQMVCC